MITANVIQRVFRLQWNGSQGTAFTVDINDRQYLVTAQHVLAEFDTDGTIEIFSNGRWVPMPVELVGHAPENVDITVLAPSRRLTPADLPMTPLGRGPRLTYGQDVYFLGYPYGFLGRHTFGSDGYPLPFVKKAAVSLLDGAVLYLDGPNNPGFSGGPVVFQEAGSREFKVAAVVSGYRAVPEPVLHRQDDTGLTVSHNTGIIVTHAINGVLDLIEQNPIGFALA